MKRITGEIIIKMDIDIEVESESDGDIIDAVFPDGYDGCIDSIKLSDVEIEEEDDEEEDRR